MLRIFEFVCYSTLMNYEGYQAQLAQASARLQKRWIICGLIAAVACSVGWLVTGNVGVAIFVLIGLIAVLYVPAIRREVRPLWATGIAMRQLAAKNDMRYVEVAKPSYDKHFLPATAKLGLWERHEQIVKGTYKKYPFETYVDTFRHPFANRTSRVATRVYSLTLPLEMPHIFMRNQQSGNKFIGALPRNFDDDQRVSLEGNYQQWFTVYTHRRTRTEALTLLAPNVMATLIDSNLKFDVEFVGNKLYLYTSDYYTTTQELQEAFSTLDALIKHLKHQIKSWKFTLPNNQHYPYLISRPGFGTVALGGKYYDRSLFFIAFYSLFSIGKIILQPDGRVIKAIILVLADVVLVSVLLVFRRKYQLSRRNVKR